MKIVVLYRPKSEYGTLVETYLHDFRSRYQDGKIETIDVDSREGVALATLYDIMQYPAILAIDNEGSLAEAWQGPNLPLMNDVASYLYV